MNKRKAKLLFPSLSRFCSGPCSNVSGLMASLFQCLPNWALVGLVDVIFIESDLLSNVIKMSATLQSTGSRLQNECLKQMF